MESTSSRALIVVVPEERSLRVGGGGGRGGRAYPRALWFNIDEFLNSLLISLVLLFCVVAPVLEGAITQPSAEPAPVQSATGAGKYLTDVVSRGSLAVNVTATGTVEPVRLVDVSSELSGKVHAVHVDTNDEVKAGQLLAELDPELLDNERARAAALVAAAAARIKEARAEGSAADKELTRKSTLAKSNLTTARELDRATASSQQTKASIEALKAELRVAESNLAIAEENLAKTRITSPINGIVLRRNVEPGQTVAASLQAPVLFRLAQDLDRMQIRVDVDEADALRVREGQPAKFSVQALKGQSFDAKVEKLYAGPEIVQGVVTYKAILSFDNSMLKLKPGMTATADVEVERVRDGLLVPNAALRFSPPPDRDLVETSSADVLKNIIGAGQSVAAPLAEGEMPRPASANVRRVFVEKNGKLHALPVSVGASDGTHTAILSGPLKEGQAVVVDLADIKR